VKTRQVSGAVPWLAGPRTACGSSTSGSRISVPGDSAVAAHLIVADLRKLASSRNIHGAVLSGDHGRWLIAG
jgi:hypothetical protein